MKLSGSYQINLSKDKVWEALNDPEILKKPYLDVKNLRKILIQEFTATATNKIGPFNASFTGDIELTEFNPPNSYKITGSGNSPVGFASGEANVKLEDHENGTNLIYEVEANVGGKIAQVGSRLIDMTAKKMADIFFGKFSELISSDDSSSSEQTSEKKINQTIEVKPKNKTKKYFNFCWYCGNLSNFSLFIFLKALKNPI